MSTSSHHDELTHRLALPSGFDLESYRIVKLLGKGGFGMTYLARDLTLDMLVAIKEMLPDGIATRVQGNTVVAQTHALEESFAWALNRFDQEARTLAKLNHPNIVRVHRLLRVHGTAYMVMEFIEGQSLGQWMKAHPSPTEQEIVGMLRLLLDGLEHLHKNNLLHLDIKPDNILLTPGSRGPVLLDFGSARVDTGRTQTLTTVVSEGYAPFEQYQTKTHPGPWTDIYALCAVMIHAITGEKPPSATDRVVDDSHHTALAGRFLGRHSAGLLHALERGFSVKPTDRPQTVDAFRRLLSLEKSTSLPPPLPNPGGAVPTSRTSARPATPTRAARTGWLVATSLALVLTGVGGLSWFFTDGGTPKISDDGSRAKTALAAAESIFQQGDYTRALEEFTTISAVHGVAEAYIGQARCLFETSKDDSSSAAEDVRITAALQKAIEKNPACAEAYTAWGLLLTYRAKVPAQERAAMEKLDIAQGLGAQGTDYLLARGASYAGLDNDAKEKESFTDALAFVDGEIATLGATPHRHWRKATIHLRLKQTRDAITAIDGAIASASQNARYHDFRASLHQMEGSKDKAMADVNRAISLAPAATSYRIRRAYFHSNQLNYTEALADCAAAISSDATDPDLLAARGDILTAKGDFAAAIRDFTAALALAPSTRRYLFGRGNAQEALGDSDSARADYDALVALNPDDQAARFRRMAATHAVATANRDLESVLSDAERLHTLAPENWLFVRYKASALSKLKRFTEALTLADKDVAANGSKDAPYLERARVYERMEKYDEAIQDYGMVIRLNSSAQAYTGRAFCWKMKEDYTEAADDFSEAIRMDSTVAWYYRERGYCLYRAGRKSQALPDIQKSLSMNSNDSSSHLFRGYLYGADKEHRNAVDSYTRAIELQPKMLNAYINRAVSYRELGLTTKAAADEAMAKQLQSANP